MRWVPVLAVGEGQNAEARSLRSSNPNGEDLERACVCVCGAGPSHRAGHTATVVHRKLVIFGGSYGAGYLADLYELDTGAFGVARCVASVFHTPECWACHVSVDPPPLTRVSSPSGLLNLTARLEQFIDNDEFADVTFVSLRSLCA
jgi:hypothetical protein